MATVNSITLGHVAASLILAVIAWGVNSDRRSWLVLVALVGLGLMSMSYAGSRGPVVALIAAVVVLVLAGPWRKRQALVNRAMVVAVIGIATWLIWHPLPMDWLITQSALQRGESDNTIQKRLLRIEELQQDRFALLDKSSNTRKELLRSSLAKFYENPIFGVSNWAANKGEYPHNLVLEAFQNLGIAGGGIFLVLLVIGSYRAWGRIQQGEYMVPLLFFQALVGGQFSGSLYANAQLWASLALLIESNVIPRKPLPSV